MADLFEALFAKLGGESTITAIVGTNPKRIFKETLPQGSALPLIAISESEDQPQTHLGGDTGHRFASVEIGCLAESPEAARELRDAVRAVLIGYRGTSAGVAIRGCEPTGGRMANDAPNNGGQAFRHLALDVFSIGYQV